MCCSLVLKFVGGLRSEIESHAASLSRVCRVGASSFLHCQNWANYSVHKSDRWAISPVLKPPTTTDLKKYRSTLLGAMYFENISSIANLLNFLVYMNIFNFVQWLVLIVGV